MSCFLSLIKHLHFPTASYSGNVTTLKRGKIFVIFSVVLCVFLMSGCDDTNSGDSMAERKWYYSGSAVSVEFDNYVFEWIHPGNSDQIYGLVVNHSDFYGKTGFVTVKMLPGSEAASSIAFDWGEQIVGKYTMFKWKDYNGSSFMGHFQNDMFGYYYKDTQLLMEATYGYDINDMPQWCDYDLTP